jgi:hypothetical protein
MTCDDLLVAAGRWSDALDELTLWAGGQFRLSKLLGATSV